MPRDLDVWERWRSAWHIGFLALLAVSTLISTVAIDLVSDRDRLEMIVGSVLLAAYYGSVFVPFANTNARTLKVAPHLAVIACGGTYLAFVSPVYLLATGFLSGHIFMLLALRWAIPMFIALCAAMAVALHPFFGIASTFAAAITAMICIFLASYIEAIVTQSERRRDLIAQLEATRRDLASAEREAGVMEERQRVAREIHDTLTQDLISIARLLESAERELPADASEPLRYVRLAEHAAREGVREARRLVWSKRPDALSERSLIEALERVRARFQRESGVEANLFLPDEVGALPLEVEVTLLRAVQEALANVRRHAGARTVNITLTRLGERVALDVCDDGVGFDPSASPQMQSFGLIGLRQRVEQLDGEVAIESAPGDGTTIAIQLPVDPPAAPGDGA